MRNINLKKIAPIAKPITVKARFDIGDNVYIIDNNQIVHAIIDSRTFIDRGIEESEEDEPITRLIVVEYTLYSIGMEIERDEDDVFESVDAALESMRKKAIY